MLLGGRGLSFCALLFLAACSGKETGNGTGGSGGAVWTGVAASTTGTSVSNAAIAGVTASATSSGSGGNQPHAPYPIVLAHGFFGFNDFAGAGFLSYFYGVHDYLAQQGEDAYTPSVDPFNDSTYRGAQLATAIQGILQETGAEKVVIIGHSQGGLDARVVAHDHPDMVAAVITVATPHNGTPVADVAVKLLADPNFAGVVDGLVNLIGAPLYDQIGNETAVTKPLHLFSQPGITAFNAAYPDAPGVFYASIAGRSNLSLGGQDCAPSGNFDLPFISNPSTDVDPLEPLLWVVQPALQGSVNDGLVRAADAKHGEFWGCIPGDHLDEIGQIGGDSPGIGNDWDYKAFYGDLVKHIRTLGY